MVKQPSLFRPPRGQGRAWRAPELAALSFACAQACVGDYGALPAEEARPNLAPTASGELDAGGASGTADAGGLPPITNGGLPSGGASPVSGMGEETGAGQGGGAGAGPAGAAGDVASVDADADAAAPALAAACGGPGERCCVERAPCGADLTCDDAAGTCVPCASLLGLGFAIFDPLSSSSAANAISADGSTIVGYAGGAAAGGAVVWSQGRADLLPSQYANASAAAVSADGRVIALNATGPDGNSQPLVWRSEQPNIYQELNVLQGPNNLVSGISGDGTMVVGTGQVDASQGFNRACVWRLTRRGDGFTSEQRLPASDEVAGYGINRAGTLIVGEMNTSETGGGYAFLKTLPSGQRVLLPPPPGSGAAAYALTESGSIVVGGEGGGLGPLLWRIDDPAASEAPAPERLDPDGLGYGPARALSADGSLVVGGDGTAFLWTREKGLRRLADELAAAGVPVQPEWQFLERATGVSADGRIIVGVGWHERGVGEAFRATLGAVACPAP